MQHVVFLCCVLLCLGACQKQDSDVKETRLLLGTVVEFTIAGMDEDTALAAIKSATQAMQKVENSFTTHGKVANTVQAFNQAGTNEQIKLSPEVESLLLQSITYQKQTLGAFDPTLGDLNKKWGFSGDIPPNKPLAEEEVQQSLMRSGVKHLRQVEQGVWIKDQQGLQLDFGAIAKGLAIDKGIETLQSLGVSHAIINAGGDMRTLGDHMGQAWRIAIRHPREDAALGWLTFAQGGSVVTSGDYERFFITQGKRYHHIIDPSTGFPATASMSVTVQAPTATEADALSTALFIMGHEKGLLLVESKPNVEAIWVDAAQKIHLSSGMKKRLHLSEKQKK